MPVDVSPFLGLFKQFQVIASGEHSHIVNLRNAWAEELDCSGKQVCTVIFSQGGVVGAVDLVDIQIVVRFTVVDSFDIRPMVVEMLLGCLNLFVRQKAVDIHHADSIMGIECGVLVSGTDGKPVLQILGLVEVESVEHQHRQGEVIDRIAMAGKLKLNGVVFMDFRQHIRAIFLDCTPAFGQ